MVFVASISDPSLFIVKTPTASNVLLVYFDDVLLVGTSLEVITHIKAYLHQAFQIKDIGPLKYVLGLEVARSQRWLDLMSASMYVKEILWSFYRSLVFKTANESPLLLIVL